MGRYFGKCPECNQIISFRDEHTDWAKFLEEEYNRGYEEGIGDRKRAEEANIKVAQMKDLLAANARVLRAEIEKQVREEDLPPTKKIQD